MQELLVDGDQKGGLKGIEPNMSGDWRNIPNGGNKCLCTESDHLDVIIEVEVAHGGHQKGQEHQGGTEIARVLEKEKHILGNGESNRNEIRSDQCRKGSMNITDQ